MRSIDRPESGSYRANLLRWARGLLILVIQRNEAERIGFRQAFDRLTIGTIDLELAQPTIYHVQQDVNLAIILIEPPSLYRDSPSDGSRESHMLREGENHARIVVVCFGNPDGSRLVP